MKANQASLIKNDDRAQVGIGTMIVFIAAILVAATAAAVLIDTSGKLQERSSSTGNEATQQVASNLVLVQVYGERDAITDPLQRIYYMLTLAPGASPVDLQELRIQVSNGTATTMYNYTTQETPAAGQFSIQFERDHGDTDPVMTRGDLAVLRLDIDVDERTRLHTLLLPEVGSKVQADFTSPNSYGSDLVLVLR
jgi:archaeal flagellin FlaB